MLQDLNEISDGKIYGINDMVRASCGDCKGCHACCEKMGDSIVLDPYDVWRLVEGTGKQFEELMERELELSVTEGLILPHLKMDGDKEQCAFLNEEGRCSIHSHRPGLCRVFPLGRIYEESDIKYFLQMEACRKTNRSKVKVGKWIDMPNQRQYHQFLMDWHSLRKELEERLSHLQDPQAVKSIHLLVLNLFYLSFYEEGKEFYTQFEERMQQIAQNIK